MRDEYREIGRFDGIEYVVSDELRFISKLEIGEDAYATLKIGRTVGEVVSVTTAAGAGATVASSGAVASTFFASTSWMAVLGLAPAAVTPIGWVVGAAVLGGGAYYGAMRAFGAYRKNLVKTVPAFINTPIDLLGAAIVDMMGSIALQVAAADGVVCDREREHIGNYFSDQWGIDPDYARSALALIEENLSKVTLDDQVANFARFAQRNRDCAMGPLSIRVKELLTELVETDGCVTEAEKFAIAQVLKGLTAPRTVGRLPDIRQTWLGRTLIGVDPTTASRPEKQLTPSG